METHMYVYICKLCKGFPFSFFEVATYFGAAEDMKKNWRIYDKMLLRAQNSFSKSKAWKIFQNDNNLATTKLISIMLSVFKLLPNKNIKFIKITILCVISHIFFEN